MEAKIDTEDLALIRQALTYLRDKTVDLQTLCAAATDSAAVQTIGTELASLEGRCARTLEHLAPLWAALNQADQQQQRHKTA